MDSTTKLKGMVDVIWRRKWWAIVPLVLAVTVGLTIASMMPKVYRATTTILVTRQSVPEDIVRTTVTLRIEERMRSLQVQIFSRAYLEQIAREFDLLREGAGEAEVEKTCRLLRERIIPEIDRPGFSWFRISVEDVDPERAAGIANRLADLFIEHNSRMRASQAAGTLEATSGWEEKYRLELAARDKEIAEFKQQNLFQLPEQQAANLQLLSAAQGRAAQLTSDLQSRNDRLVTLRAQQAMEAASGVPTTAAGGDEALLVALRRELKQLLASYTEENPLVKRKRGEIAHLERELGAAATDVPGDPTSAVGLDATSLQISALENEIKALARDRAQENRNVEILRDRIAIAPQRQQRYLELTRDYATVKQQFDAAVVQREQARRAQELEASRQGEQFQVQDPAFPPSVPHRPDLGSLFQLWMVVGVALGAGATTAREFLDQTVRNEEEFVAAFPDLPVYGVIPNLDADPRARVRSYVAQRRAGAQVASVVLTLVVGWMA